MLRQLCRQHQGPYASQQAQAATPVQVQLTIPPLAGHLE